MITSRKFVALLLTLLFVCGLAYPDNKPKVKRKKKEAEKVLPVPVGQLTARPQGSEWIDLFDADHAAQWKQPEDAPKLFEITDGVFHIYGHKPMRHVGYMAETFGDFQLHIEFSFAAKTNSGVMFRAAADDPVYKGMEIQVQDDFGVPPTKNTCGSLYDVATPMWTMVKPAGEWNSYDITTQGQHLVVVMNGWKVLDLDLSIMTQPIGKFSTPYAQLGLQGYLFLQDHGGEIWYRNAVIKKL